MLTQKQLNARVQESKSSKKVRSNRNNLQINKEKSNSLQDNVQQDNKQLNNKKVFLKALLIVIKLFIYIFDFVSYPYYYVKFDVANRRKQHKNDEQSVVWDKKSKILMQTKIDIEHEKLENKLAEFETYAEMMRYAFAKNAGLECYGYRKLTSERFVQAPNSLDKTKLIKQVKLGPYNWIYFWQFERQVEGAARGFLLEGVRAGDKVMLYADTRAEWQISYQALSRLNAIACTMYSTLGEDGILHCVNETGVRVIVAQGDKVQRLLHLKDRLVKLELIIYFERLLRMPIELGASGESIAENESDLDNQNNNNNDEEEQIKECAKNAFIKCVSFNRLLQRGIHVPGTDALVKQNDKIKVSKDSIAVVMYTSGSTGMPKGVCLSHRNLISTLSGISYLAREFVRNPRQNCGSGYLPLAHIYEFSIETLFLFNGVKFGYCSSQTLLDQAPGLWPDEKADLSLLKPTWISMVPLVLDRISQGTKAAIKAKGRFAELLITFLINYKANWARKHFDTPLVDKLICSKINAKLGGRTRYLVSGSAPLSSQTQDFIRNSFNLKLMQGFGATETTAATTCQLFSDMSSANTGPPLFGIKVRLESWHEAGYLPNDKPNPRGEIIVGGDSVARCYFNLQEQTSEAFFVENNTHWFRTGDIGEILPNGSLKIIDRKKDLVKLQNGEYISLGKVESVLKSNSYTDHFCVYANSSYNYIVALAPANQAALIAIGKKLVAETSESNSNEVALNELRQAFAEINDGCGSSCFELICRNELVVKHVLDKLTKIARERDLLTLEVPKKLVLLPDEWSETSNLVTAAMKIRRNFIYKRYEKVLSDLYA